METVRIVRASPESYALSFTQSSDPAIVVDQDILRRSGLLSHMLSGELDSVDSSDMPVGDEDDAATLHRSDGVLVYAWPGFQAWLTHVLNSNVDPSSADELVSTHFVCPLVQLPETMHAVLQELQNCALQPGSARFSINCTMAPNIV
jgi:hypothetical protein